MLGADSMGPNNQRSIAESVDAAYSRRQFFDKAIVARVNGTTTSGIVCQLACRPRPMLQKVDTYQQVPTFRNRGSYDLGL